jgi:transcriptional regulator with XRE-family HTH domain
MSSPSDQADEQITPMGLRERVGLTQLQVAVALGKTPGTISNWERRAKTPELTLAEVQQLAELYECSVSDLVQAFGPAPVKITLRELEGILALAELPFEELVKGLLECGYSQ